MEKCLRNANESAVFDLIGELEECRTWRGLVEQIIGRMHVVVPGENPAYNEVELPSLTVTDTLMHEHYMEVAIRTLPAYNHYALEHPLLKVAAFEKSINRAVASSEFLSRSEVERNPVYNEALKYTDAKDQMLFSLVLGGNRVVTICQGRMKWGYSYEEQNRMQRFADLVIPLMQRKHREFVEREKLHLLLSSLAGKIGCSCEDLWQVTPSEIRVASELIRGQTHTEVADRLGISSRTVAAHSGRLFEKLHLENRHQLAAAFAQLDSFSGPENT